MRIGISILGLTVCLLLLTALGPCAAQAKAKTRYAQRVVLVLLDSFSPHYMAMYDLPNLRKLANEGVWYARAQGVFPSNTTANHTSILTGAYPDKTGIPNNSRYDRALDRLRSPLRDIRVPTLPEILAEHALVTVELAHFLLEGRNAISYKTHGPASFIDAVETHDPDLLIYLDMDVDTQGHRLGPYKMLDVLSKTDRDLGEIIDYLERQGKLESTAFIVASDHSIIENSLPETAPRLLADLRQAGFSVATTNQEIRPDTDLVAITAGSIFLYCRDGRFDQERLDQLVARLKAIPSTDVFTEADLRARHADPYAVGDIVVAPRPGYVLTKGGGGGMHGVPETEHTTLLLSGAGVQKGLVQGRGRTVDIAPTILHLLGLEIPQHMDGEVLRDAIQLPPGWRRLLGL
jgi:predicted AlkP superfamily pyrophosphatase or phosphodiesterase